MIGDAVSLADNPVLRVRGEAKAPISLFLLWYDGPGGPAPDRVDEVEFLCSGNRCRVDYATVVTRKGTLVLVAGRDRLWEEPSTLPKEVAVASPIRFVR